MLYNMKLIFPITATYIINFFQLHQGYLLLVGEILFSKGKTQGYPPAMGAYALGILNTTNQILLEFINRNKMNFKEVALQKTFLLVAI